METGATRSRSPRSTSAASSTAGVVAAAHHAILRVGARCSTRRSRRGRRVDSGLHVFMDGPTIPSEPRPRTPRRRARCRDHRDVAHGRLHAWTSTQQLLSPVSAISRSARRAGRMGRSSWCCCCCLYSSVACGRACRRLPSTPSSPAAEPVVLIRGHAASCGDASPAHALVWLDACGGRQLPPERRRLPRRRNKKRKRAHPPAGSGGSTSPTGGGQRPACGSPWGWQSGRRCCSSATSSTSSSASRPSWRSPPACSRSATAPLLELLRLEATGRRRGTPLDSLYLWHLPVLETIEDAFLDRSQPRDPRPDRRSGLDRGGAPELPRHRGLRS